MLSKPMVFNDFLTRRGLIDDVYKAMSNPDLAHVVMTVLEIAKKTDKICATISRETKSEKKSNSFRTEGNQHYARRNYHDALICYNKALLYAPKDSRSLKLAYSNRSALLYKANAFSACIQDINTCFSLGCPSDIIDKLCTRKEDARKHLWTERVLTASETTEFSEQYFQLGARRNPQIKSSTMDVGVIIEDNVPKIVATTDIKVGTVLAIDSAFVSQNHSQNAEFSCYYCQKMHMNLIPCEQCCTALFCDQTCQEKCMKEYHSVECQIMAAIKEMDHFSTTVLWLRMAMKAVLKMKHSCKTWRELTEASQPMGLKRMKSSSINEIFDSSSKFSLLNLRDEKHFLHGVVYNSAVRTAYIVYNLDKIPGFYPLQEEEKYEAQCTVARLLMFLTIYSTTVQVIQATTVRLSDKTSFHDVPNYAWFPFYGKLKDSCNANVLAVGLNKEIAIVAQRPIKRGAEITISCVGHWLDRPLSYESTTEKNMMFVLNGTVCNCDFCNKNRSNIALCQLSDAQKNNFRKLKCEELMAKFCPQTVPEIYTKACKMLALLTDVPFSKEYEEVYRLFRKCILYAQDLKAGNYVLSSPDDF